MNGKEKAIQLKERGLCGNIAYDPDKIDSARSMELLGKGYSYLPDLVSFGLLGDRAGAEIIIERINEIVSQLNK